MTKKITSELLTFSRKIISFTAILCVNEGSDAVVLGCETFFNGIKNKLKL